MYNFFHTEFAKDLAIVFVLGFVIALAFVPFFSGKILEEDDVTYYYIPAFKFYHDSLSRGESVSLNPHVFSGFPLALSQVGGFYDPLNFIIFKIFSFPFAYHLRVFLNYWFAAIFTFLFARSLQWGRTASLVAAFSYITAQNFVPGLNILRSNSFFLMPGLFYIVQKIHSSTSVSVVRMAPSVLFGALVFGISFLGGYTQLNLYSTVAVFFFTAFLAFRRFSWRFLAGVLAVFAFGAALSFPQLLRILEFIPYTSRAEGISWEYAAGVGSGLTASALKNLTVNLFVPPIHFGTLQSLYIGSFGVFFFLASLLFMRGSPIAYFFIFLFVFSLISAFPYPLFWLMHKLPFFSYFRFPPHWLLVSSFAMSILAGSGYQFTRTANGRLARIRGVFNRKDVVAVLIILLIINFLLPAWYVASKLGISAEAVLKTPWVVEQIKKRNDPESFRTFNFYPGDSKWFLLVRSFNPPHKDTIDFEREVVQSHMSPSIWGIASIRGFDNFVPKRYQKVLAFLEQKKLWDVVEPKEAPYIDYMNLMIPAQTYRILGMMNVKYMWSSVPLSQDAARGAAQLISRKDFKQYPRYASTKGLGFKEREPEDVVPLPIYLYENKEFVPRAYSPPRIVFVDGDEDSFSQSIVHENDFRNVGFIECGECRSVKEHMQNPPRIRFGKVRNDTLTFYSEGTDDAWVIISNSFLPRWRAFIDGEETKLYYANYIYQGILIPKGTHEVVLRYD